MLEIKISVKIEGLDRLADALFAIAGAGQAEETSGTLQEQTTVAEVKPVQTADIPVQGTVPAQAAVPAAEISTQPVPAAVPVQTQAIPVAPSTAVPVTPPAQQAAAVPVSATSYSMDDLAHAAMALMDAGKQAGLQALLAKFGVESLPLLPPAHYGAFATGMREMGAQI